MKSFDHNYGGHGSHCVWGIVSWTSPTDVNYSLEKHFVLYGCTTVGSEALWPHNYIGGPGTAQGLHKLALPGSSDPATETSQAGASRLSSLRHGDVTSWRFQTLQILSRGRHKLALSDFPDSATGTSQVAASRLSRFCHGDVPSWRFQTLQVLPRGRDKLTLPDSATGTSQAGNSRLFRLRHGNVTS